MTTLAEETTRLEALAENGRVAVEIVGESVEGRPIRVIRVGATEPPTLEDRPEILLVGLQHGNEGIAREALLDLAEHLATTSDPTELDALASSGVVILPTLNPDGYAAGVRRNANGVDLNRDHFALSQPETRALAEVISRAQPVLMTDHHEASNNNIGGRDAAVVGSREPNAAGAIYELSNSLAGEMLSRFAAEGWDVGPWEGRLDLPDALSQNGSLRYAATVLVESNMTLPEADAIQVHLDAANQVLRFAAAHPSLRSTASDARVLKTREGEEQSRPFTLQNAGVLLDPPPTGYRLTAAQVVDTASHRDLLRIDLAGDLITMGQDTQPLIPYLLDPDSKHRIVAAERVYDDGDDEPPGPDAPAGEALPAGIFSPVVTWLGCDLLTGRIIAELPEVTGNIGRLLGAYTSANLSTPIPSGVLAKLAVQATVPMRTMIVAVVNGQPCWAGIVLTRQRGTGATMDLATATPEVYLNRRTVRDHNWRGRDEASVIAAGLVRDAGDVPGVGRGIGLEIDAPSTGRTRDREYAAMDRATVYERLRELMGVRNGPEFTIEPMWGDDDQTRVRLVVRIRSRIGIASTQPRAVFESQGASSATYTLTEDYSDGKGANYVMASSSGEGEDKPTSAPAVATDMLNAGWPIVEHHFEPGSNISNISTLNEHAQRELELLARGANVWTIDARWNVYPSLNIDWRIGDDIAWNLTGHGHPDGTTGTGRCIGWELRPGEGTVSPILLNPQEGTT